MKYIIIILMIAAGSVWAHPTSYEGSLTLMSMNNEKKRANTIHYSPTFWTSFGVTTIDNKMGNFYFPRIGLLVKRWNQPDSQGNIYAFGGYGSVRWEKDYKSNKKQFTNYGVQADWEDRQFFIMGKYNRLENSDFIDDAYMVRLGYAPYIAQYSELNSWFMLQYMYHPRDEMRTMVTPMIRMFYKNILWEFGSSIDGSWMLNFSIRQFL